MAIATARTLLIPRPNPSVLRASLPFRMKTTTECIISRPPRSECCYWVSVQSLRPSAKSCAPGVWSPINLMPMRSLLVSTCESRKGTAATALRQHYSVHRFGKQNFKNILANIGFFLCVPLLLKNGWVESPAILHSYRYNCWKNEESQLVCFIVQ